MGRLTLGARLATARAVLWVLARTGDPLARLLDPSSRPDVYRLYADLRRRGPVARSRTGEVVVSSYPLCHEVLRDGRFRVRDTSGRPADADPLTADAAGPLAESFLEQDPPDHTRLRRIVAPLCWPRLVRGYRERIETVTEDLLDRSAGRGHFDLVRDLAAPLPITVISELLGIPAGDTGEFARFGMIVGSSLGGVFTVRQAEQLRAASDDLAALFARLERERAVDPGDDAVSLLAQARAAGQLDPAELMATCGLLLIAGFETTVNLIGNAVGALAEHQDQWRALRADPGRAVAVVEETLRYDPPVQLTVRVPHEPVELGGVRIEPDMRIMLALGAAHRDPTAWPDPDRFDPDRSGGPDHLAFGSGIHYCLGAPLARLEAEVALQALARRLPVLRPARPWKRRSGAVIRGFAAAPLAVPVDRATTIGHRS